MHIYKSLFLYYKTTYKYAYEVFCWSISVLSYTGSRNGPEVEALVRLVDGMDSCSGRVEVLYDRLWGTVCDSGWDLTDAQVACYEAGCGPAIEANIGAFFGEGSGDIWRSNVGCLGSESSVMNCWWLQQACTHQNDAGVVCQAGRKRG